MNRLSPPLSPRRHGIVHLGLGAFFRAHAAIYIDETPEAAAGDWGITGVSLRHPDQRDKLQPQNWAYNAVELAETQTARQISALTDVLVAKENPDAVLARLVEPDTRLVTLTVTEKGYCHEPSTGKLNEDHPDIHHDLTKGPVSAPGYLVHGLAARKAAGLPPFTIVSLDNLPANGRVLQEVTTQLAALKDPVLADWITQNCAFPSSMVDRIVPATTDADIALIEKLTGYHDAAPVMHEPFRQWVLEDNFCGPRPDLAAVGVEIVKDVAPYEHMKLRLLNGAHSSLAYIGLQAGFETVAQASADPDMRNFTAGLWDEAIEVLTPPSGADPHAYTRALQARFENPGIRHLLRQIAMDGSQKLPQRLIATLMERRRRELPSPHLLRALAAWIVHAASGAANDPMKDRFARITGDAPVLARGYLALSEVFPAELATDDQVTAELARLIGVIQHGNPRAILEEPL